MAGETPLPQLRKIRDEERRIAALRAGRDQLIREAIEQGYTQQQVANAAGLSQSRVQEVITGRR